MKEVAASRLKQILQKVSTPDKLLAALIFIHRSRNAPPRDYVSFVDAYHKIYQQRHTAVSDQSQHLESGLNKLREAAQTVDELKQAAAIQQAELDRKQQEAAADMSQIQTAMEKTGERKTEMQMLQRKLAKDSAEITTKKQSAEQALSRYVSFRVYVMFEM